MKINIRPVEKDDYEKILEWRNEPLTRSQMFNTEQIKLNEHLSFWNDLLDNGNCFNFIIEADGIECGVIRLDIINTHAEFDLFITSEFQGRGIGKIAIEDAIKKMKRLNLNKYVAKIKPTNIPSIKSFEKNGFELKYLIYEKII